MIIKTLWVLMLFFQFLAMFRDPVSGSLSLMLMWIILYGLPLFLHMRNKQLNLERMQALMFQFNAVSKMWAFLTWDESKYGDRFKNYTEADVKEKLKYIKEWRERK